MNIYNDKNEDQNDKIDQATIPEEKTPTPPVTQKLSMRWFWTGFAVAIPVSFFILGSDPYMTKVVRNYSLVYFLASAAGLYLYALVGNPKLSLAKYPKAFGYFLNLGMFVGGHAIGFATINLFRYNF